MNYFNKFHLAPVIRSVLSLFVRMWNIFYSSSRMNHHLSNKSCHFGESSAEFTAIGSAFKDLPSLPPSSQLSCRRRRKKNSIIRSMESFEQLFEIIFCIRFRRVGKPQFEANLIEKVLIEARVGSGKGVSSYSCRDLSRYTIWLNGSWGRNKRGTL